jgi:hypothetical protein
VTLYLHYVGELDNWEVRCGFCVPRQVGKPQSGKLKQETYTVCDYTGQRPHAVSLR